MPALQFHLGGDERRLAPFCKGRVTVAPLPYVIATVLAIAGPRGRATILSPPNSEIVFAQEIEQSGSTAARVPRWTSDIQAARTRVAAAGSAKLNRAGAKVSVIIERG